MRCDHANLGVVSVLACVLLGGCAGKTPQEPGDPLRAKLEARESLTLEQIANPQQESIPVESTAPRPQPSSLAPHTVLGPSDGMTAAPLNLP